MDVGKSEKQRMSTTITDESGDVGFVRRQHYTKKCCAIGQFTLPLN